MPAEGHERFRNLRHKCLEFGRVGYFEPGDEVSRCRLDLLRVYGGSGGEPDCHAGQQYQWEFMVDIHERSPPRSVADIAAPIRSPRRRSRAATAVRSDLASSRS